MYVYINIFTFNKIFLFICLQYKVTNKLSYKLKSFDLYFYKYSNCKYK